MTDREYFRARNNSDMRIALNILDGIPIDSLESEDEKLKLMVAINHLRSVSVSVYGRLKIRETSASNPAVA